ncbi:MAG: phosphatidylserine decarboxylase [Ruminococcus sp.]|nr:phosphatidylserine decarboxylase [Ruminococcus sp.]
MDTKKTIDLNNLKKDSTLKFLYENPFGRIILKGITLPFVSSIVGKYMSSSLSKRRIKKFISANGINMEEYEDRDFHSFNDFFTRKIKENRRPLPQDKEVLFSPCDGKLSAYKIDKDTVLPVKGSHYTISQLLNNNDLAEKYSDGYCLVFRLAVDDYHRYSYIDSGVKGENVKIKGKLHTVQPIALEKSPVFIQNSREYTVMHTENFGDVVQVEVGALMVGKIKNHQGKGKIIRGEEKGMFLFGGSTIILLLNSGEVRVEELFFENTKNHLETVVKLGESLGRKR